MTAPERFEQDLPQLLRQLAAGPRPDYRDSLVEAVARTPQRPAWTFPGRWLPVHIATAPVRTAPVSMRPIALVALLLLAVIAAIALVAGSQPRLPAPFGPAVNGLIVYGSNGDLYALAPESTQPSLLLGGETVDRDASFSRDGQQLLFLRDAGPGRRSVHVMRPDGTGVRQITSPLVGLDWADWSPDGTTIAFSHRPGGLPVIAIADLRTGIVEDLELPGPADLPVMWRPGHGDQLTYRGSEPDGRRVLKLVDLRTMDVRTLDIPADEGASRLFDAQRANWSGDGRRLVVEIGSGNDPADQLPLIYLKIAEVSEDGRVTSVRPFVHDPNADYEYFASFTPDGGSLLFSSQRGCTFQAWIAPLDDPGAARPVGGPSNNLELTCGIAGISAWISPDGKRVLASREPVAAPYQLSLGTLDGAATAPLNILTDGWITWQRVAP